MKEFYALPFEQQMELAEATRVRRIMRRQVADLLTGINQLESELRDIQRECKHVSINSFGTCEDCMKEELYETRNLV